MIVIAWLRLLRAGNCTIIALAAYTGYLVGGGTYTFEALLLALSALLISAGGNTINDYFDAEIDAVNKPWRPIPSGIISRETALAASILAFLAGTALGFYVSPACGLLAAVASALLTLYSWKIKRKGLLGNLTIAGLSALNLVYGGLIAPKPLYSLMPAAYAFLIITGREILKGLEDVVGDRMGEVKTLAVVRGEKYAFMASTLALMGVIAISPIPLAMGYGPAYFAMAVLGVDLPIIVSLAYVWGEPIRRAWRATRILKIPLFAGLLAFLLGAG